VLRRAADRAHEVPEESARHLGREQYRRLARGELAPAETRHGTLPCVATDGFDVLEIVTIPGARKPVVALHVIALLREQHAADAMTAARVAIQKTEGVAVHTLPAL